MIHAFQALELFLEDLLRRRLNANGLDAQAVDARLDAVWRTKERLRDLLREATGRSLIENRQMWDQFCTAYDQTRNKLIHTAKDLDTDRTKEAVQVCREVIRWLEQL